MEKVAVVTGAGRGIGKEIARRLIGRGYAVLVTDINLDGANQTAGELGERAWAMALDVRDPDAHRNAAAAASERGRLEVWVNNAGVVRALKAWEHPDEEVRLMVESNLLGVIWGSRAAIAGMRRTGAEDGRIINIASLSALGPVPGISTYAATKHAVLGFSTSLQGDLDHAGIPITVHVVCPDAVDTPMVQESADDPDAAIIFSGPRLLEADEVADKVVALLDTRAMVLVLPRWRGWLSRVLAPFPRFGLKLLALFRRVGERRRPSSQPR
jgi:NAD(P)-dependent dehydrogenase (short-subunit alcohol dehydrogenase family)